MVIAVLVMWCLTLVLFAAAWERSARRRSDKLPDLKVSVVIPVRNEAHHIGMLLRSLKQQTVRPHEILVVDDHSDDNLSQTLAASKVPGLTLLRSPGVGKKQAIAFAVGSARGDIMVTTDGDCVVGRHWVESMIRPFAAAETLLTFGPVRVADDGRFFSRLQGVEFSSLIGAGAAMATLGRPVMCNGANLAYRKRVFEAVNGYGGNEHIASGDDEFLMRKVMAISRDGVHYNGAPEAVVTTLAQADLRSFLLQRLRWASKWGANTSWVARTLAVCIFLVQCVWIIAIVGLGVAPSALLVGAVGAKVLLEAIFTRRVCLFLGVRWSLLPFLVIQAVYPFYVVGVAVLSPFLRLRWKGRPLRQKAAYGR